MGSRRMARRRRPSQAATSSRAVSRTNDGGHEHQKQAEAAPQSVSGAERQADDRQQREEGVDAQLDAHPTAQRD